MAAPMVCGPCRGQHSRPVHLAALMRESLESEVRADQARAAGKEAEALDLEVSSGHDQDLYDMEVENASDADVRESVRLLVKEIQGRPGLLDAYERRVRGLSSARP